MLPSIRTAGPVSGNNNNNVIVHKFRQASDLEASLALAKYFGNRFQKCNLQHREIKHNKSLGYGGERERLLNGIILTSLSTNFFTDLRKASVDMPKPQFASSISQSANDFFWSFFIKKKKKSLGKGINPTVKGHSPN